MLHLHARRVVDENAKRRDDVSTSAKLADVAVGCVFADENALNVAGVNEPLCTKMKQLYNKLTNTNLTK
jgi:hypothetical protein